MGGGSGKTVGNVEIFDKKVTERNGKIITKIAAYKFISLGLGAFKYLEEEMRCDRYH